jgi:hypothetical protein
MSRYHGAARRLSTRFRPVAGGPESGDEGPGEGIGAEGLDGPGPGAPAPDDSELDDFTAAYAEAALWSSNDDDGEPLDSKYGFDDIDPDTMRKMRADCAKFQQENAADIAAGAAEGVGDSGEYSSEARAGHDFWLTRNGHGVGFWDGDWPEPAATRLTDAAHAFGEVNLYVGDQGRIHSD